VVVSVWIRITRPSGTGVEGLGTAR